jgi:hypothetical protein
MFFVMGDVIVEAEGRRRVGFGDEVLRLDWEHPVKDPLRFARRFGAPGRARHDGFGKAGSHG